MSYLVSPKQDNFTPPPKDMETAIVRHLRWKWHKSKEWKQGFSFYEWIRMEKNLPEQPKTISKNDALDH